MLMAMIDTVGNTRVLRLGRRLEGPVGEPAVVTTGRPTADRLGNYGSLCPIVFSIHARLNGTFV